MLFIVSSFLIIVVSLIVAAYLTNPFNRVHIVKRTYIVTPGKTFTALDNNHKLKVRQERWRKWFTVVKLGVHFMNSRYIKSPRSRAKTVDGIIADIRKHRFKRNRLLLTSGDHFSPLFVRNLGVFYYPTLDRAVADSEEDWDTRQTVYAQTVAYALGVFAKYPIPATTIVATGPLTATCVNFHAYPSDTVYGMLYALAALQGKETATPYYYAKPIHQLKTAAIGENLARDYHSTLIKLYNHYRATVFDEARGLIRTDVRISGAKDITKRQSSFFDNVVFWKTTELAIKLGLIPEDKSFLQTLKTTILDTFWLTDKGYFLEDLSEEGKRHGYYSSDWLIVLVTGFLDPANKKERHYFTESIRYIQEHKIDQPFPIKYQQETRAHRQFPIVRLAVASYGGDAIWSFWGMEYIKLLLLLAKLTGNEEYAQQADAHLSAYEHSMIRYGGFPEVYNAAGDMLQTPLYRSVRQTGWVIGFEQARTIRGAFKT